MREKKYISKRTRVFLFGKFPFISNEVLKFDTISFLQHDGNCYMITETSISQSVSTAVTSRFYGLRFKVLWTLQEFPICLVYFGM